MIHQKLEALLLEEKAKLYVPAENVAILLDTNTLDHAMLVLSQVHYSVIPVLNKGNQIVGLISIPMIINQMMSEGTRDTIHFSQLHKLKVKDVMQSNFPIVNQHTDFEDVLNKLVDHNFLCLEDNQGKFAGIITRKEILKRVNYTLHELDKQCEIIEK